MVILMRHVNEPIPAAVGQRRRSTRTLSDWIDRLLIKDPRKRTQTAREAWDELEEIILELVGPRWRRSARLDEPEPTVDTPRPLTPAPFETKPVDKPSVSSAVSESGFVTFDPPPFSAEPAAVAPPGPLGGRSAEPAAPAPPSEPATDRPASRSPAQTPASEPDVGVPAQPVEQEPGVSETGFVTFTPMPAPRAPTGEADPEQMPTPCHAAALHPEPSAPVQPDHAHNRSESERATAPPETAPAASGELDRVSANAIGTPDYRDVSAGDPSAAAVGGPESQIHPKPPSAVATGPAVKQRAERVRAQTERTERRATRPERPAKEPLPSREPAPRRLSRPWILVLAAGALAAALAAVLMPASGSHRKPSTASLGGTAEPAPVHWQTLKPLRQPIEAAGVAAYQGQVWVVGGARDENHQPVRDVYVYHPGTHAGWRAGPPLPEARAHAAVVAAGTQTLRDWRGRAERPGADGIPARQPDTRTVDDGPAVAARGTDRGRGRL